MLRSPLTVAYYFFSQLVLITYSVRLNRSSLMGLLTITDSELDGFGFRRHISNDAQKITDLLYSYPANINETMAMCPKIGTIDNRRFGKYFHYPQFQTIFLQCLNKFMENQFCLATCILAGIIKRKDYGDLFIQDIYDENNIYEKGTPKSFQSHKNIFCYTKEFRSQLLNEIISCKLLPATRICIVDDAALRCKTSLGNCNFDENEAFAFTTGNSAHRFTCETLNRIKWNYFENSTRECILPESKILLTMKRYIFKNCEVCSIHRKGQKFGSITEYSSPPSKEEFLKAPYSSLPIVIRNGANIEGMLPLNFTFLKQLYRDFNRSRNAENEKKCIFAQFTMSAPFESLADAFSLITDDSPSEFDWYIGWEVCNPEMANQFKQIIPRPSFLPEESLTGTNFPWMVAGSPGSGVFDHVDYVNKPIWQAQLSGHKKWYLRPPPECHHVCKKLFVVTINQGDLFLLHNNAWHHMTVVEKNNLSITYGTSYDFKENF